MNAAKAGTQLKAPLTAELALYQDEITTEGPYTCTINNQQTNCWKVKPTGIIKTTKITNGAVTFTPTQGEVTNTENLHNGQYRTRYTAGATPAKNLIEAFGESTVNVPEVFYDQANNRSASRTQIPAIRTLTVKSGQYVAFEKDSGQAHTGICGVDPAINQTHCVYDTGEYAKTDFTVYGVKASLAIEPNIILLNDEGYTTQDIRFKYTIQPLEYNAIIADVDVYKMNLNSVEPTDEWINYIPGDKTQGEGTAGFVQGSKFNINMLYKAEVVLNRGVDIEIRSTTENNTDFLGNNNTICEQGEACVGKVKIPIAQLNVVTDNRINSTKVDEVKFGDGSKPAKRYRIALQSPALSDSCGSFAGTTLRTANRTGQTINIPGSTYYPAEHPMTFVTGNAACRAMVNGKYKFVVSNLSTPDLEARESLETDTAVLYGGLGNKVFIELNGLRKEVPIEPVGVIVLGIDGLRQDVLYAPSGYDDGTNVHSSYNDPQGCGNSSCYVQSSQLKGLCEVFGGKKVSTDSYDYCNSIGWENKHVKLKDVTTIFPSITFAAWASIFTGKTPNETGILGNEFFARDIYADYQTIPGMYRLPTGIVTLDADGGAFRPIVLGGIYSKLNPSLPFVLNYVMPGDFDIFRHSTMQEKLASSAPGQALHNEARPLWQEINEMTAKRYQTGCNCKM